MAQSRFNFTGVAIIPKATSKRPFVRDSVGKDGKTKQKSLNFGVKDKSSNTGFVELFGTEQKVIKAKDSDGNNIEIKWEDRFDEDIVKEFPSFRKTVVDLGEEFGGRQEFISSYDAIAFLEENLPKYEGSICVTGQMKKDAYKGRYYDKFPISGVYSVDEERKHRLTITADIYYNKDCIDKTDYATEKKIYLNGYVEQYINKDEGNKFIPHQFILNTSKYTDSEHHQNILKYKMKYVDINKKTYHHITWETVLVNGTEQIEFDESQLTASQKEQIELGIRTLEDFRPKGRIFGEQITEYRLFDPVLTGDFVDGFVDCEMTNSEFEDEIYVLETEESLAEVMKKAEEKEEVPFDEVDDDDLF